MVDKKNRCTSGSRNVFSRNKRNHTHTPTTFSPTELYELDVRDSLLMASGRFETQAEIFRL